MDFINSLIVKIEWSNIDAEWQTVLINDDFHNLNLAYELSSLYSQLSNNIPTLSLSYYHFYNNESLTITPPVE